MPERTLVIDHLKFSYEGLFNLEELYTIFSAFFFEKGWEWYEKMNEEQVTAQGKQIRLIFKPWKNISDYYKIVMNIKLNYVDVKDVEVEHEGKILRLNHGVVRMTIDAYVISDRKGLWKGHIFYWFISILANKYFYREHYAKAEAWIKSDVDDLFNKVKNYLNVFKYSYQS
jgi:hypothetical protein